MADKFAGRIVKIQTDEGSFLGTVEAVAQGVLHMRNLNLNGSAVPPRAFHAKELADLQVLPDGPQELGRAGTTQTEPERKRGKAKKTGRKSPQIDSEKVDEEFDFQKNLNNFDKAKVFEEIRKADPTTPQSRLVANNKLGNRDMVLGSSSRRQKDTDGFVSQYGVVPLASSLQLVQLEQALVATGRTQESIIELAARGISDVSMRALGTSRFDPQNHNRMPLVLALVGFGRSGIRALAACRLLASRNVHVVAIAVADPPAEWDAQLKAFRAAGGEFVQSKKALEEAIDNASSPLELVIDALQGFEATLPDLYDDAQLAAARWLLDYASSLRTTILCVDSPSEKLRSKAQWVAACGFPVQALSTTSGKVYVIDLAIPRSVLSTVGMRRFEQVSFGASSLLAVDRP